MPCMQSMYCKSQMYKKAEVQKMEQFCQVTFTTAIHSEPKLIIPFGILFGKQTWPILYFVWLLDIRNSYGSIKLRHCEKATKVSTKNVPFLFTFTQ